MKISNCNLTDGALLDIFEKVRANFYNRIDVEKHVETYLQTDRDLYYAEPEFTGKFMDICAYFYEKEGNGLALEKGLKVFESVKKNMRSDGYTGCLKEGEEKKAFSIWNQAFTLYGLTRLYEATGREDIIITAERAAEFIINAFKEKDLEILNAGNGGSQHISFFYSFTVLYRATKKEKYLNFIEEIITRIEKTDMNLISFKDIFSLRSVKGIEMLIVFLGVMQWGIFTNNLSAISAADRYFREVNETQIRNTGNATVKEVWVKGGNLPRIMKTEEKPNETCVAVGFIELALSLFHYKKEAYYLNAVEKTLFNHILGSVDESGEDFAYYQGNIGKKIFKTGEGMYQCCRYRGFTLISYLQEFLFDYDGNTLIPMIYASAKFKGEGIEVIEETNYPCEGNIKFKITTTGSKTVKLKIPNWVKEYKLFIEGKKVDKRAVNGFIETTIDGYSEILLSLEIPLIKSVDEIEGRKYISYNYGVLLLASETENEEELEKCVDENEKPIKLKADKSLVKFKLGDLSLVDFASAGKRGGVYTVYIPVKE